MAWQFYNQMLFALSSKYSLLMEDTNFFYFCHSFDTTDGIARAERDGTGADTRFCLSPKQMSPFNSVGASDQLTAGSRGVRISDNNAGYTMFQGSVNSTGYPLHSPVSPSLLLLCVTVCHQVPNELYHCIHCLSKLQHAKR
jgi:hypothetical protein